MGRIVTYVPEAGRELTPEQLRRIMSLKDKPIVFDRDCPEMTDEELKQFHRPDTDEHRRRREARIAGKQATA